MRRILVIAKKEFMDNWRNKWILAVAIIFLCLTLTVSYFGTRGNVGWKDVGLTVSFMMAFVQIIIPIIGLMLGYATIVGEKEKGSLGVLLSYPVSRKEVIIGKFLGLGSVIFVTVVAGFGIAGVIIAMNVGKMNVGEYIIFIISSILLGLVYLAIAILVSSIIKKRSSAMGAAIFLWFLFAIIWGMVTFGILFATGGEVVREKNYMQIYDFRGLENVSIGKGYYEIAYGNGSVYLLGNDILIYGVGKIDLQFSGAADICWGGGKIFIAGETTHIYDGEWHALNISSISLDYGEGNLYLLKENEKEIVVYNISSGKIVGNITLPHYGNKIVYGDHHLYVYGEYRLMEYDFKEWQDYEINTWIEDMDYGDGFIYMINRKGYIFNVSTKRFFEIPFNFTSHAHAIAYGNKSIYLLKSEMEIIFPGWYYAVEFLNPNEIYGGILALSIEPVGNLREEFRGEAPSFYNIYTLSLSMFIWIVVFLVASIYIFERRDI